MTRKAFFLLMTVLCLPLLVFAQTDILINGGFENWTQNGAAGPPDNWTLSTGSLTAQQNADTLHQGNYAVRLHWTTTSTARMEQKVDVTAGYTYEFKMWILDNDPAGRARISIRWLDDTGGYISTDYSDYTADTLAWVLVTTNSVQAPAGADSAFVQIRLYDVSSSWDGEATIYADHAVFLETPPQGLSITSVSRNVKVPLGDSSLTVECTLTGGNPPYTVQLNYSVNGVAQTPIDMTNTTGDIYQATIPAQGNGARIEYFVGATDNSGDADTSATYRFFWGISPISNAPGHIKELDNNGVLQYADYYVMVEGVGTVANGTFSSSSLDVYLQDANGGINIYKSGAGQKTFLVGHRYRIVGVLDQYRGKTEIVPDDTTGIEHLGPTTMPDTLVLTIADILADPELYEGRLIRINNVSAVPNAGNWPAEGSNANISITDGTDTLTLRIDRDTDIDGSPEPDWPIHLVGILGQYDTSSPYTSGYQILPRSTSDLIAIPKVDYPPDIEFVQRTPKVPAADQNTTITAKVSDDKQLAKVELRFQINDGSEEAIAMTPVAGDTFTAEITADKYADGDRVLYWIYAEDDAGQVTMSTQYGFFAGITPIATLHTADSNGVILYADYYATVIGTATVEDSTFHQTHLDVYIQDATGGLNIFQFNLAFVDIFIGNQYQITGKVAQYRGKTEIMPDDETDIVDLGAGTPVDPLVISIADLLADAETYEGMLVRLQHVENTGNGDPWPTEGNNANLEITDDGTNVLTLRVDRDTDIDGQPEPQWPRDVIGIFSQYDRSSPYTDSYQILPRAYTDFQEPTAIAENPEATLPERYNLYQNFPNPFNPNTTLRFDIPKRSGAVEVELAIYNTLGQKVKTLFAGKVGAGQYEVTWDGRSDAGKDVAGGIYFAILKTREYQRTIKLVFLK
ncbi:MAG: T9SS type A sorting domain-containing protein [Calditrichaeota bacterium]|nr:T9SS type A sorting domain-containing protein [Calditrichota bacterium]